MGFVPTKKVVLAKDVGCVIAIKFTHVRSSEIIFFVKFKIKLEVPIYLGAKLVKCRMLPWDNQKLDWLDQIL